MNYKYKDINKKEFVNWKSKWESADFIFSIDLALLYLVSEAEKICMLFIYHGHRYPF